MKTVLLTGAGGFIGRTTIKPLLFSGYTVHAVTSKEVDLADQNLFLHNVDLLDARATAELVASVRPSHLLHFAWYVEHGKFWNAVENADWVKASYSLLSNFAENGGKRAVMAGTCAEYDWHTDDEYLSDTSSKLNPQTVYGKAKLELYNRFRDYAAQSGMSYAWGRIFFLFGPYEAPTRFVASVIRPLLQDQYAECSHGSQLRDFMFVEDAGKAFVALLDSDVQGAVNVADGTRQKMKDIAAQIAEITGKLELLQIGARAAVENEPASLVADITRLRNDVKFKDHTDLTTALEKTIGWWKKHL